MSRGGMSSGGSRGGMSFGGFRGGMSSGSSRGWSSGNSSHGGSIFIFNNNNGGSNHISNYTFFSFIRILFFIAGIMLIFWGNSFISVSYGSTTGYVLSDTYTDGYYYTSYTYNVDGVDYESTSFNGWKKPSQSSTDTIYYKLDDPSVITEDEQRTEANYFFAISLYILSAGLIIVAIILCFKRPKNDKPETVGETTTPVIDENETYCEYCGSKCDKNSEKCSQCGANIKSNK